MQIAIVGCGFVADFYMTTLPNYPHIKVKGILDRDKARQARFASHYSLSEYDSMEQLLADDDVQIVLNLTNPKSHYELSKASLAAGKHVYSEKPLSMDMQEAQELVDLAEEKGLHLSGAPCSVLSAHKPSGNSYGRTALVKFGWCTLNWMMVLCIVCGIASG